MSAARCTWSRRDSFALWRPACKNQFGDVLLAESYGAENCRYCGAPITWQEGTSDYPGFRKVGQRHFGSRLDFAANFADSKKAEGFETKLHSFGAPGRGREHRVDWFEATGE